MLVNRGWVPGSWRDDPPTQKHDITVETPAELASVNGKNTGFLASIFGKKHETIEVSSNFALCLQSNMPYL